MQSQEKEKHKKNPPIFSQDFSGARMIALGLSVLGLGLAIAWVGFLFFAH